MPISRFLAWTIWGVASIFYAYQYILRVMPNIMLNDIMQKFEMDAVIFGQFSGIYYIGYVAMNLPLGIMLDRYGPRKVMSACIALSVVGILPIIFTDNWIYPVFGRFLTGIGSSAAILGAFKIIRMSFIEKHFTRMLSITVSIGLIGAIYGGGPVNYLCESLGYNSVIMLLAIMGMILAVFTYIIVPEMTIEPTSTIISDIKEVIYNKRVIATCIFAGLMVGPLEGFADVWGTIFLKHVLGFDNTIASSLPSMIFIGMCFGAPFLSFIAEKTNYLFTISSAGIIMASGFCLLLTDKLEANNISIIFIIIGICSAYQILAVYKASTYVSDKVAGLTTAISNMIIMFFGYIFHTMIGSIVHHMGGINSKEALIYGISIIPFALTIGAIGFMMLQIVGAKQITK